MNPIQFIENQNLEFEQQIEMLFTQFAGMIFLFLAIGAIVMLLLYVYKSIAYMRIGQKAKISAPGLAWIPRFGPNIVVFLGSKMHWWPWLLLVVPLATSVITILPFIGFFIYLGITGLSSIVFLIYTIAWNWKTFEKIGHPGWLSILLIIPLINLIIIGIVAFSREKH
ncbi:MAG: hypothetical protein ACMXYA_03255 [Candidatus Woesearchaeota archaeon]